MRKDADICLRFLEATKQANELGMTITMNGEYLFVCWQGQIMGYSATIDGVRGYLEGYADGQRVKGD